MEILCVGRRIEKGAGCEASLSMTMIRFRIGDAGRFFFVRLQRTKFDSELPDVARPANLLNTASPSNIVQKH